MTFLLAWDSHSSQMVPNDDDIRQNLTDYYEETCPTFSTIVLTQGTFRNVWMREHIFQLLAGLQVLMLHHYVRMETARQKAK